LLDRDGPEHELPPVDLAAAKFAPQPEQLGMLGQRFPAEAPGNTALGEFHDPQQVAL
jgi:hypothetical protein